MSARPQLRLVTASAPAGALPHDPAKRGYVVVYRHGEQNHCPGCGRAHWWIGRRSAECAFCATTLPFEHSHA
ncbi:MAG TPA: hypothetical protein VGX37_03005 [Allosphingosinicella sp.]|jgi:hypothetical protein|nr:hypothetical protein [Allosphingosinicella sp.]